MDEREQLCGDLDELLEVYGDMVYRVALQNMGNITDARDVTRDVFLRILKKKPQFTSTIYEKAWALWVTVNTCKDYWKCQRLRKTVELQESLAKVKEDTSFDLLYGAMQLPVKYHNAIYLFYYEGLSVATIAGILQRKEATILIWLHRTRERLKNKLEEGGRQWENIARS